MRLLLSIVFIAGITPAALAQGWLPQVPPLPRERPEVVQPAQQPETVSEDELAPVPEDKPDAVPVNEGEAAPAEPAFPLPRPRPEPKLAQEEMPEEKQEPAEPKIYQTACPAVIQGQVEATQLPPMSENQCTIRSPLSLTGVMVNGRMVEVTGGVVADCSLATVLPQWAAAIDGYLSARSNTQLTAINVGTSYFCRGVNNTEGGNISEHGFGNALDVTGFVLEDGRRVSLPDGWTDPLSEDGRLLRFAHDSACGLFTTTLGPEANALHRDHFHVDMGCHGERCVARLCE